MIKKNRLSMYIVSCFLLYAQHSYSQNIITDQNWISGGNGYSQVNGEVSTTEVDKEGRVFIGGAFTRVQDLKAGGLAYWDGKKWHGMDKTPFLNVKDILFDSSGVMYVAGMYSSLRSIVAKWDGIKWDTLGSGGFQGAIFNLIIDKKSKLYAGGNFSEVGGVPMRQIAQWDGSKWNSLDDGLKFNNTTSVASVSKMVLDTNGDLIVGGFFDRANSVVISSGVARWNGTAWSTVGDSIGYIHDLAIDKKGNLYASGDFDWRRSGMIGDFIAKWNGTDWVSIGNGNYFNDNVRAIAVDSKGTLYAGGGFGGYSAWTNLTTPAWGVAKFNGTTWEPLGSGIAGSEKSIASLQFKNDDTLLVGGSFTNAGGTGSNYFAFWTGSKWSGFDNSGVDNRVFASINSADSGLIIGGEFSTVDGISAKRIARFYNGKWQSMGSGFDSIVYCIAQNSKGEIFAGGNFAYSGTDSCRSIAKWNGSKWIGLSNKISRSIKTIVFDEKDNLYVGGDFYSDSCTNIAMWDGSVLKSLNGRVGTFGSTSTINAMCFQNGNLYVAGNFSRAGYKQSNNGALIDSGIKVRNIAVWNGTNWSGVSTGVDHFVYALYGNSDGVIAAGSFDSAGGVFTGSVARWNGTSWKGFGNAASGTAIMGYVRSIFVKEGVVFIGGDFEAAKSDSINNIAYWNGNNWARCGTGIRKVSGEGLWTNNVYTISALGGDTLFVGGAFDHAGSSISYHMAKFSVPKMLMPIYNKDISRTGGNKPVEISVFANNHLQVISQSQKPMKLSIYAVNGSRVAFYKDLKTFNNSVSVAIPPLPKGAYIVKAQGDFQSKQLLFTIVK